MSETDRNETDPTVPWYQRGGFTTIAVIGLVLGAAALLALVAGLIFNDFELARAFVPYPAVVGLLFSILGVLGPWRLTAILGVVCSLAALIWAMLGG